MTEKFIFMEMEPRGDKRLDWLIATLACLIANINRDPKKTKPFKASDFLLRFQSEKERVQDLEEMMAASQAVVMAFGGTMGRLGEG